MKNWLIRTTDFKILGPISAQKTKELIDNGTLKDQDEVCSGNGYWFWVKEKDLVEKYLDNEIAQDFNPISECESVLGSYAPEQEPKQELEQTQSHESSEDITIVGHNLADLLKENTKEEPASIENNIEEKLSETCLKLDKVAVKTLDVSTPVDVKPSWINSKFIYIFALIFFLIALSAYLYRDNVLHMLMQK